MWTRCVLHQCLVCQWKLIVQGLVRDFGQLFGREAFQNRTQSLIGNGQLGGMILAAGQMVQRQEESSRNGGGVA